MPLVLDVLFLFLELLNEELPFVFLLGLPLLDGLESTFPAEFLLEFLFSILSLLLFLAPLCLENFERDLPLALLLGPLLLEKLLLGFDSNL